MSDLGLFRIRNQTVVSLSSLYARGFLWVFVFFMVGGNFLRLFPLPPFPSHISIGETFLYLMSIPIYLVRLRKSLFLLVGIGLSTWYGTLLHGLDIPSVLYGVKLGAMIMTGVALGEALFKYFGENTEKCCRFFLRVFFTIFAIGLGIFIFFPKAHLFFQVLQNYGIHFTGDPHQRRFISPFFDPNYYGAIACIPLILSWIYQKKHPFYSFGLWLFLGSIFFTFSRSGIATAFLVLISCAFSKKETGQIRGLTFFGGILIFFFFGILLFIFSNETSYFFNRLFHLGDDPSAHARWITSQAGIEYFFKYPFFGVGYHYLSCLLREELGMFTLDSSLLITLGNFGLIPCIGLIFFGMLWSFQRFQESPSTLFKLLYSYLLICVFFTSQFNQLVYYPYWLVPMIGLFTYLEKGKNARRHCP